jgi:hypothetical protein
MSDHLKVVPFTGRNPLHPVEYRKASPVPPDESGFYYAREQGFERIEVVEVIASERYSTKVFRTGAMSPRGVEGYDWFGPVTQVRQG